MLLLVVGYGFRGQRGRVCAGVVVFFGVVRRGFRDRVRVGRGHDLRAQFRVGVPLQCGDQLLIF